jgi:hypothetical protein
MSTWKTNDARGREQVEEERMVGMERWRWLVELHPSDTSGSRPLRVAHVVSDIANPLYVALPTFLVVALHSAPSVGLGLLWWLVTAACISTAPLLLIARGVRAGRYTDRHLSRREQRALPLIFGIGLVVVALGLLTLLHASRVLLATVVAVLIADVLTLAITTRWKISVHLVGMTGAVTVMLILYGWVALPLVVLVPLVAWARWEVRAHTPAQAVAGAILATLVTIGTFALFGVA